MSFINTRDLFGDQGTLDKLVDHTLEDFYEDGIKNLASYALMSNSGLKYVEMPELTGISTGDYAFGYCPNLISASFLKMRQIPSYMFHSCPSLTSVYIPNASSCGYGAFSSCYALTSISLPNIISISAFAFARCSALSSVAFPSTYSWVTTDVFSYCINLTNVDFPGITTISDSAFYGCVKLSSLNLGSSISTIRPYAFFGCMTLGKQQFFSYIKTIYNNAFGNCGVLFDLHFSAAGYISQSAFRNTLIDRLCIGATASVQTISIYSYITNTAAEIEICKRAFLYSYAFNGDYNLSALILRSASCTLQVANALASTPIASGLGYIYTPSELVSVYKSSTNWATYANQIVSIDEYPKNIPTTDTIPDSWPEIFAAEENGTYTTKYSVGDTKTVDIGKLRVQMQIVAMDTDELADNSGNAKITWISVGTLTVCQIDPVIQINEGWEFLPMRKTLQQLYNYIDEVVKSGIKSVKKTFYVNKTRTTNEVNDLIWMPSLREIFGAGSNREDSGCTYTQFFDSANKRMKQRGTLALGSTSSWWLRSQNRQNNVNQILYDAVTATGVNGASGPNSGLDIVIGFCT